MATSALTTGACAKINLGLRVLGRREDGYHDIITVLQRISLADELTVAPLDGEVVYRGPVLTDRPEQNLCLRAAKAFRERFGREKGAEIELRKRIPSGAGLGGGSSDAATVLRAMAQLYGIPTGDRRLFEIAALTGSDVAFFLTGFSTALARGRGELLEPCRGLGGDDTLLVLWPGFPVSTDSAYRMIDDGLTFDKERVNIIRGQFSRYEGGDPTAEMTNDFEGPLFAAHPELARARDRLKGSGARIAGLCGSGSALFGLFDGEALGRAAAHGWRSPWLSFVCRPY